VAPSLMIMVFLYLPYPFFTAHDSNLSSGKIIAC
jgi:hypothetical protein